MRTVSVIVPVYDVEDYIEECLSSIAEQTYPYLEIICINDASPDNSITHVRRFMRQDPRMVLVQHNRNRGLGAARNTGLRHATGAYIKFVDGDDALLPDSIEALVATLERTHADWAFGDFHVEDEHGRHHSRSPFHVSDLEERARAGLLDVAADPAILNGIWPSAWMGIWRADRIEATASRFPEGLHFEDHEFFFVHGFGSCKAAYLNKPLYVYRSNRPGQITRDVSNRIFDIFVVIERLLVVFSRHLKGETLERFSARAAVRLLIERTWAMPGQSELLHAYRKRAATLLARFPREVLFEVKDWYITDEALEKLCAEPFRSEPSGIVRECDVPA